MPWLRAKLRMSSTEASDGDHVADVVVDVQQLVDAHAALVAGVVAALAARAVVELVLPGLLDRQLQFHQQLVARLELRPAVDADLAHQPLGENRLRPSR